MGVLERLSYEDMIYIWGRDSKFNGYRDFLDTIFDTYDRLKGILISFYLTGNDVNYSSEEPFLKFVLPLSMLIGTPGIFIDSEHVVRYDENFLLMLSSLAENDGWKIAGRYSGKQMGNESGLVVTYGVEMRATVKKIKEFYDEKPKKMVKSI